MSGPFSVHWKYGGDSVLASFKSSHYLASSLAYMFQRVYARMLLMGVPYDKRLLLMGVPYDKRLQHVVISSCASSMDEQSRSST